MKKLALYLFAILLIGGLSTCKKPSAEVTGIIEGMIINSQTSEPIRGAIVTVGSASSKTTGDDGKYRFEGLEAKEYAIQVQAEGFETDNKTIIVVAGETKIADFSLTALVPELEVSATSLDFSLNETVLPLAITNKGKGTLTWSLAENVAWMSVNPVSGSTTSESSSVNITVDRTGLSPRTYTQSLIINSNGGNAVISITMIVQGPIPTASFTLTPAAGALSQSFQVDASSSVDDIDPVASLFIRWRWEDGGAFTDWATIKTAAHQYDTEGLKNITLEVRDSDGNVGTDTKTALVSNSLELPTVTTIAVNNITGNTASSGGTVVNDGGSEVLARGVCWSLNQNPSVFDNKSVDGAGLGTFTSEIIGLTSGSTYYVRAYASNSVGSSYGNQIMFVAGQNTSTPTVTTIDATNITPTTASSGGAVSSEGSSQVTTRGVCWSTSQNPTTSDSKTTDGVGTGSYISLITGLSGSTTYYCRAYAINSAGTSYGNEITFITSPAPTAPAVNTMGASNITETSALGGGEVTADGGSTVTARGVCWSTAHNPTIDNSHTSNGNGLGLFNSNITGLSGNTDYYVRAYATNIAGTSYGNEVAFKTLQGLTIPAVYTTDATNITESSALSGGDVVSDGGDVVAARGVCWSTNQNPTLNDSHTTDGTGLGLFNSVISGLATSTTYYIRAYATNSIGTGYGSQKSFITVGGVPTVSTKEVTNILETTAIGGGIVLSDGGSNVTERGVCYSLNENPTIYDYKVTSGSGNGAFTTPLNTLIPGSAYNIRAYAINQNGTGYGENKIFTTLNAYYVGFENGMPNGWTGMWTVSSESPFEGYYCLKSIYPGESIEFTRTITNPSGGQFVFYHSGNDGDPFDSVHTDFYIDDVLQVTCGDEGWTIRSIQVTAGSHTFKWINAGGGWYNNVNYIDFIICPE
jgi:hypothetical protein